jgi:hypothetical protein
MQSAMDDDSVTSYLQGVQQVIITIIIVQTLHTHMAEYIWDGLCHRRVQDKEAALAYSILP